MTAHHWVGAALVGMGEGDTRRAEHAARTGRHVLPSATRIQVLEVYCGRCRVEYGARSSTQPCTGAWLRNAELVSSRATPGKVPTARQAPAGSGSYAD